MHLFAFVFAQHSSTGDLTFLGWTTALAYGAGSFFCVRAAIVSQQAGGRCPGKEPPWWILACILLSLGLNKLLNLQTVLINLGRTISRTQGWDAHQRAVQAVFVAVFTLVLLITVAASYRKWRWFAREQPWARAGVLLLLLFVVVRVATLNHVDSLLHLNLYDDYWAWSLELLASACLAWSAAKVETR